MLPPNRSGPLPAHGVEAPDVRTLPQHLGNHLVHLSL
jgi:hypothetical protein